MAEKDKEDIMDVQEAVDGSATVNLPDDIESPQKAGDDQENEDDDDQQSEDSEDDSPSGSNDDDEDQEGDTDALRSARRERRRAKKQLVRQTNAEKELKLQMLERQNQELIQRLSVVERKTHSADLARIDKAIEDAELRINYAKMKLGEAAESRDGNAMAKAQEVWMEARQQAEALRNLKKNATRPRQENNIPDPRLQRLAADWMERNPWYDPNTRDMDSRVAKQVDEELTAEGWDPTKIDYWRELDKRLPKYLPHRYNDDTDVNSNRRSKPRGIVTGSGRESAARAGGRNSFTLSPEQVRAMKDAGFWDNPERRQKMIKRYAEEARQNQGNRS